MWFRNLQIYRLPRNLEGSSEALDESLAKSALHPCGPTEPQCVGWVAPSRSGALVHAINRQWLVALGVEQRLLPTTIVRQLAADRAKTIEEAEGRRVGRKELRDLCEALTIELMPRAFIRRRTTFGWIDPINGWLVIDAGAQAKAEEFLEHLRKTVDGFPASLLKTALSPT